MKLYSYTAEDLTDFANSIKDVILDNMLREGVLTAEQCQAYVSTHIVTVMEKKTLFRWLKQKTNPLMILVSKLPFTIKDEDDDNPTDTAE